MRLRDPYSVPNAPHRMFIPTSPKVTSSKKTSALPLAGMFRGVGDEFKLQEGLGVENLGTLTY